MEILKVLISIIPVKQRKCLKEFFHRFFSFTFVFGLDKNLLILKRKINLYFLIHPSERKKFINEIDFLNKRATVNHSYSFIFPYSFVFDYDFSSIEVYRDDQLELYYVLHNGRKLYYSKDYQSELAIRKRYCNILIEQDEKSPHCYLWGDFNVEENDIVMDIGSAEGNFSLDIVERASKLYIVEPDIKWIEALNATFRPWKDKVHIVNKFVSDIDNDKYATLSSILENDTPSFIKMDVEGAEVLILESSMSILNKVDSLKLAICTYHKNDDAKILEKILLDQRYDCSFSTGYMLFIYDRLKPPYFRTGLLKAKKHL